MSDDLVLVRFLLLVDVRKTRMYISQRENIYPAQPERSRITLREDVSQFCHPVIISW